MGCRRLTSLSILLVFWEIKPITSSQKVTVDLEKFEQTLGFDLVNATGITVTKFNATTYVLNGTTETFQDFADDHMYSISMAHSKTYGNFKEWPFKVVRQTPCQFLNGVYKDYQKYIVDYSNLPRVGDERYCPFRAGTYWVKEWTTGTDWVVPIAPAGYWRFTADLLDKNEKIVMQLQAYIKLMRKGVL
ncbi:uncharacterized protein LOC129760921 [Uranotaenia lowii]|uniref:uncharacterized protein LOC129738275 n=1 Tax=Uranotaenia lowii TaxID=190385 RepID=UPI00247B24E1|nr:uncharacterized protein LOC129738275 [Uranotaenia lowii]XP_055614578.1 uncharacterized protein LOC129760921 [Uranotaenia lowii]